VRLLLSIALGLFLLLTVLFCAAEALGWLSPGAVAGWLRAAADAPGGRAAAASLVIGLLAADLVLPVPSSVVMTLSGGALGWPAGTAAAFTGAMVSALTGFALCRRFGQPAFERLAGAADAARVDSFMRRFGRWGILLSRSVPMLTEIVSCLAGLSRLPAAQFVALTAAGTLPLCAIYAWAGSRGDRFGLGWTLLLAFLIPAAGFLIAMRAGRRR
jgi:uncharacterized membrane protein YdjX (TVP38/TMEM64 family)